MRSTLKFLIAFSAASVVMLAFRALVFTIYTVPGPQLEPVFKAGDRVMVNRWAYGLRTGGGTIFSYGRLWQRPIAKGDWLALDDSTNQVFLARCTALPGDTIRQEGRSYIVPGRQATCAQHDYYQIDSLSLICEEQIIGRVFLVVYNHTLGHPLWMSYDTSRFLSPL
jgi:signal peptidase I